MDSLSGLTNHEIAYQSNLWGQQDAVGKIRLYEQSPKFRGLFVSLLDDPFYLFKNINPRLWPELVSFNCSILNRSNKEADLLTQILRTLQSEDAIKAFRSIQRVSTRLAIIERLSPKSHNFVTQELTEAENENRKEDNPQDVDFFIDTENLFRNFTTLSKRVF